MSTEQTPQQTPATEEPSPLERRVDLVVTMANVDAAAKKRLQGMAKTAKLPGFRPGKVPMKLMEQNFGAQARSEALGDEVEKMLNEHLQKEKLRVAGRPRIEPKAVEGDAQPAELGFTAIFETYPEVVVGDLAALKFKRGTLSVGDEEVQKTIDVLRRQRTRFELDEGRAAEDGDRITVDFRGTIDGEAFDGGTAEGFVFMLGAGSMLPDFETASRGLKKGDEKAFDLKFPEEYHAKHLAGKTAQFTVTMHKVEKPVLPEIDAAFARALGVADGDVVKLREEVKGNLEREVKRRIQVNLKSQVLDALLEHTPIVVPRALVAQEAQELAERARRDMQSRGMKTSDFKVEAGWFQSEAERRVKIGLILSEVIHKNSLYAKPEDVRAIIEDMAQSYEDPQELIDWYYADPRRLAPVEALAVENKVVDWVVNQAQTTEEPVSFEELMGREPGMGAAPQPAAA